LLAARTGQVLNVTAVADAAGIVERTAATYVSLLEAAFVVHEVAPWAPVPTARTFRKPKVHILDSGLAAHLLRLTEAKLAAPTAQALTAFGQVLESFVVSELLKEASWLDSVASVGYWRTYDGAEVDFVVERFDGAILAFEIKAAQRLRDADFAGLRTLREKAGPAFTAGVVLHTGPRCANPDDRIYAMPIEALWSAR
ncbi:MAG: DUF4143 domain-containing protein, partial [Bifidobacteriaceae bacterium]|nr:DUF4143 domain-containing protein [Bifidobacteriaceae bacterium]